MPFHGLEGSNGGCLQTTTSKAGRSQLRVNPRAVETSARTPNAVTFKAIEWEPVRGNELTFNSSGNTLPQSPQLTEPLLTDPGAKNGIYVCKLIIVKNKIKKSAGGEWIIKPSPKSLRQGKSQHLPS